MLSRTTRWEGRHGYRLAVGEHCGVVTLETAIYQRQHGLLVEVGLGRGRTKGVVVDETFVVAVFFLD